MPQIPPTNKRLSFLLSTTTDITNDSSSTLRLEQSKKTSTDGSAEDTVSDKSDIQVNKSTSTETPKEGSLAALLIGDSGLRHVDRRRSKRRNGWGMTFQPA